MSETLDAGAGCWADAVRAAERFAVDPSGCGGVVLRALPGPVRDAWLELLGRLWPVAAPLRRVPAHVDDTRLLGGLDLAATLASGRPVAERGVLAEAHEGAVVLAMAERLPLAMAARLGRVLDVAEVALERDGIGLRLDARIGVVALDEGIDEDEGVAPGLRDRLAFHIGLADVRLGECLDSAYDRASVREARERLGGIEAPEELAASLCHAALALGIDSLRAPMLALRVARASAALDGCHEIDETHASLAARLVLAPRATRMPPAEPAEPETPNKPDESPPASPSEAANGETEAPDELDERVLEAAAAAIPPDLLARIQLAEAARLRSRVSGKAGIRQVSMLRGRPTGARRGDPRSGARLSLVETLRAAAPWQPLRRRRASKRTDANRPRRVEVRRDDFRVARFAHRSETTTIFVVDASGSAALHRLAEAKGAVELLLAECYVRRDRVALVAFRGTGAEFLLPPTRSLTRAKRSLASLPGGGGTPLASGIDAAAAVGDAVVRRGGTPVVVFMTDGRANVGLDGTPGRARGVEDAAQAARRFRAQRLSALLVDTSPRPQATARELAGQMDAVYLPLPHADARALSESVRLARAPTPTRSTAAT